MLKNLIRLSCVLPVMLLAACNVSSRLDDGSGGSGGDATLTADRSSYLVGEVATLTPKFTGKVARIDPGLGAVTSGVAVKTPALRDNTEYKLVVGTGADAKTISLTLQVRFRNSYRVLDQTFAVSQHAAVALADGSVLVSGGSRGLSILSTAINRFDPVSQGWTQLGVLNNGRSEHQMTLLASGKLLITGGNLNLAGGAAAELFDPTTGISLVQGAMLAQRLHHTATLLNSGKVLITGGSTGEGFPGGTSNTAELWDPATQSFTPTVNTMTTARANHNATLLSDGKVLITGGYNSWGTVQYAELYDPLTNKFSPLAGGPAALPALQTAAARPDGSVWLLGGENQQSTAGVRIAYQYLPSTGALSARSDIPLAQSAAASVVLGNGDVLMFGGYLDATAITNQAQRIGANDGSTLANMPSARLGHTATRLPDGRVLIVGGQNGTGTLQSNVLVYE
ncbi:Kelch repeat-containing protein [Chitinimonas sp.]|uniref:Kelch repeat-containing protein n=1 Tax=Chitinimonas sp. TaxID=1934313 RepID=UPI002F92EDBA